MLLAAFSTITSTPPLASFKTLNNLKSAMMEIFTPRELAYAANQSLGIPPLPQQLLEICQHPITKKPNLVGSAYKKDSLGVVQDRVTGVQGGARLCKVA